ncbi:transcriptional regulatory protein AlgP-like [Triplophysa rosa]|uniref:transcriptional regulatory protein AlgP-like n=1 Tax=Triplophysa rosa TaxID=992332 RepID=UPI002545EE87|nr:transcriptional regulatory protein AlgP-like [Triplophysa rosa]XP_057213087.1 transcriptional regulatory protein AlgP-like [Triplophysa rosa]
MDNPLPLAEREELIYLPFSRLVDQLHSREKRLDGVASSCPQDSSRFSLGTVPEDHVLVTGAVGLSVRSIPASSGPGPPSLHGRRGRRESWDSPSDSSGAEITKLPSASPQPATYPVVRPRRKKRRRGLLPFPPAPHPAFQPANQLVIQAAPQPVFQPASSPAQQPGSSPMIQPASSPVIQPASSPVIQPASSPVIQPASSPVQPASQPVIQPASQPASQPAIQPAIQPASHPASLPAIQPASQPAFQPASSPVQPAFQPASSPVQPVFQPASSPVQPAFQPVFQPVPSQAAKSARGDPQGQGLSPQDSP